MQKLPRVLLVDPQASRRAALARRLRGEALTVKAVADAFEAAEVALAWKPECAVVVDDLGDSVRALRTADPGLPVVGVGPGREPDRRMLARLGIADWLGHAEIETRLGCALDAALRDARARARDGAQRRGMLHLLTMASRLTTLRAGEDFHRVAIEGFATLFDGSGATGLFVLERARDGSSVCAGTGRFREVNSRAALLPSTAAMVTGGLADGARFARGPNWVCVPVQLGGGDRACLIVEGVAVPDDAAELCAMYAAQVAHALSNALLYERATIDGLTGLNNRACGLARLSEALSLAARHPAPTAICLLDVDRFKSINDTWGHLAGDEVLRGLAGVLRSVCRDSDNVCRFGGEEFLVVLPRTGEAGATRVAERIRTATERWTGRWGDIELSATVSIGVAVAVEAERDPSALIARADAALYDAKRDGRNKVCRAA